MRMTTIEEELQSANFVREAADHFADHPEHTTYTRGEIMSGVPFAVRWGLGKDCVLAFIIGDLPPAIYQNCIEIKPPEQIIITPPTFPTFDDDIPF